MSPESKILFVDDGSTDATWDIVSALAAGDARFEGASLSRNVGHQRALYAGLMLARGRCDIAISMDCDGQDDVTAAEAMVDAYLEGFDVVYGVRSSRGEDTAFKRTTAEGFYRLMKLLGAEVVPNHADYRLLSARALDGLAQFGEANLFLRGIVPMVGYPSTTVEYERTRRVAGESHYPVRKMVALAADGVTSLSVKPVRMLLVLSIFFSLVGLAGVIWAIATALVGHAVSGWASTMCAIFLMGGITIGGIGVVGEYVGKIYLEVKARPRYLVAESTLEEQATLGNHGDAGGEGTI